MNKVIIDKQKIYYATFKEDEKKWIKQDIARLENPFSWYLPYTVEIEKKVTVKDILLHLKRHENHVSLIFCGYLGDAKLDDFIREVNVEPDLDFKEKIELIEFYWNAELEPLPEENGFGEFAIHNNPSIRGVNTIQAGQSEIDEDFDEEVDLSLVALRNYANDVVTVNSYVEYATLEELTEPLPNVLMDGEIKWTLFNLISTLLTEISFYGTPEDQKMVREDIIREEEEMVNAEVVIEHPELISYLDGLTNKIKE